MSNANQIHLLSLAADTLNHIATSSGSQAAADAREEIIKKIADLTNPPAPKAQVTRETSTRTSGQVGEAEPSRPVSDLPACDCGKPGCALIDVLTGTRTDFTVTQLVEQMVEDFGLGEASGIIIEAIDRVELLVIHDMFRPDEAAKARMLELEGLGAKYVQEKMLNAPNANVPPAVKELVEGLLRSLQARRKPE